MNTNTELVSLGNGLSVSPLIAVQRSLAAYEESAADFAAQCSRALITDAASYHAGSDLIKFAAAQLKQLEAYRKAVKQPIDDYAKLIQSAFKPVQEKFERSRDELSKKMLEWRNKEEQAERERQEAERRRREQETLEVAVKAEREGNVTGANALLDYVANAPPPRANLSPPSILGSGTVRRTHWIGDVIDPIQVLREIVAGNLPLTLVEFSRSALNRVASDVKQEGEYRGIKISKSETLR